MFCMKKYLRLASLFAAGLIFFAACKKDTPAPTATISETISENVVSFTVTATDAEKFEWDFGDGSVVSTIKNPTHTYAEYGRNYSVSLKVTGAGGEITVTKTITIAAMSRMTMLTGGAAMTNGKKWRISRAGAVQLGIPDADLTVIDDYPAGVLTGAGMDQVYNDEFIFKSDGSYTISPQSSTDFPDGGAFAGLVYCMVNEIPNVPTADGADAGLTYIYPYTPPTGVEFTLNENKDLTVATNDGTNITSITYNGSVTLSFDNEAAFFGIKDFINECKILEMTSTSMKVVFFASITQVPELIGTSDVVVIFNFEVAP